MDRSAVYDFVAQARNCALVMGDNANYIRIELPNVEMTTALRAQTELLCTSLLATQIEVMGELVALSDLPRSESPAAVTRSRVRHIVQLCREEVGRVDDLVVALQTASDQDGAYALASVLVTESATNILNAVNRTEALADSLAADANGDAPVHGEQ